MNEMRARVLVMPDAAAVAAELRRLGCDATATARLTPHALLRVVRVDGAPTELAGAFRAEGGEAVAAGDGVVLIGSEAQFAALARELPVAVAPIVRALAHFDRPAGVLRCGPYTLPLGRKTYVMGIVNVTPDSFSGDGVGADDAVRQAERMLADGADLLDVGGESTRPGADPVPLDEELRRVVPAVRALARLGVPVSVDTYKSAVARAAVEAGAVLINDISGLRFDPAMAAVAADARLPVVVMHIQGEPRTMQAHPAYADLMTEIADYLQASTALAVAAGLPRDQVVLDPGFGFGKTPAHNLELVRRLRELTSYGQPVLLGPSRKATIGKVLGDLPPGERVEGTAAVVVAGILNGADIVRVHDVQPIARAARLADAIARGWAG
jgi:dihydropteroate synthase